jgi:hypothetical protein
MYKVGIVTSKGRIEAKNFATREEVDNYILSFDSDEEVTHFRIDKDGITLETEQGKRQ